MRNKFKTIYIAVVSSAVMMVQSRAAVPDASVARGAYLVKYVAVCGDCHSPKAEDGTPVPGLELSGGAAMNLGPVGRAVPPNITSDVETGIGSWSARQIVDALRNGRRPDGSMIGPPMPIGFYKGLADADAFAIAAYLKSTPPVRRVASTSRYQVPLSVSYGPPVEHVAEPATTDKVSYGSYLAGPVAHCMECHTPMTKGRLDLSRLGAGGREFTDLHGDVIASANITSDPVHGIGKWSDQMIKNAIVEGVRPDGTPLIRFMPFSAFSRMSVGDLDAIVAYLRTLRPSPKS